MKKIIYIIIYILSFINAILLILQSNLVLKQCAEITQLKQSLVEQIEEKESYMNQLEVEDE